MFDSILDAQTLAVTYVKTRKVLEDQYATIQVTIQICNTNRPHVNPQSIIFMIDPYKLIK